MAMKAERFVEEEAIVGAFAGEELARLNDALDEAEAEYQRGEFVDAEVVLRELQSRAAAHR